MGSGGRHHDNCTIKRKDKKTPESEGVGAVKASKGKFLY